MLVRRVAEIGLHERADTCCTLFLRDEVDLIEDDPAWLAKEGLVVLLELLDNAARIAHRIGVFVERGEIDDMQQQAGALQMTKELVAQAGALRSSFNEAGNVGDYEAAIHVYAHDAQLRVQSGEGIIRD